MKKNLTTQAGRTEQDAPAADNHINAINQVFAILRRNYHNQYYKALPDENELSITKRLWLESLRRFEPDTILQAARSLIESSEYFPTLRTMIRHCEEANNLGLPNAHQAYLEACRATSPKANFQWSHLAVYYAGKSSDWYFLQNNNEQTAFPVFKQAYDEICRQVLSGLSLASPQKVMLEENTHGKSLDKATQQKNLSQLRQNLNL